MFYCPLLDTGRTLIKRRHLSAFKTDSMFEPSISEGPVDDFITSVPFGIFPLRREESAQHHSSFKYGSRQRPNGSDLQSGHLEDGAVHLVGFLFLVQQAVGAAAQAAVQGGRRDRGVARPVAGPS